LIDEGMGINTLYTPSLRLFYQAITISSLLYFLQKRLCLLNASLSLQQTINPQLKSSESFMQK